MTNTKLPSIEEILNKHTHANMDRKREDEAVLLLDIAAAMKEYGELCIAKALEVAAREIDLDCNCDSWQSCQNQIPDQSIKELVTHPELQIV